MYYRDAHTKERFKVVKSAMVEYNIAISSCPKALKLKGDLAACST
jgi:hypothetical protein